jgi:amino acid permease
MLLGIGSLTIPYSFSRAGVVLGSLILLLNGFLSYVTATFMIESLAGANAIRKVRNSNPHHQGPLVDPFEIVQQIEVGEMAEMVFTHFQTRCVSWTLILYLYGALCAMAITVAESLQLIWPFTPSYTIFLTACGVIVVSMSCQSFEHTYKVQVVLGFARVPCSA